MADLSGPWKNLNTKQFFHGTRYNIPVGGVVLPSAKTGVSPNHGISMPNSVYMASEKEAWGWAGHGYAGKDGVLNRPYVARVTPVAPVEDLGYEATAPAARVEERIDVKPGHQATFPSLNWNQFAKPYAETNHPSDADISGGHDAFARKYRPGFWDPPEKDLDSPEHRFEYDPHDPDPGQRKLF